MNQEKQNQDYRDWVNQLKIQQKIPSQFQSQKSNLNQYILPLVWIFLNKLKSNPRLVIGLNGMQGSGKTTLGSMFKWVFQEIGISFDSVSIDDFYLSYKDRLELDQNIFKYRGPPGTHDVQLMHQVLRQFKNGDQSVQLPQFNKALHNGQGDRIETRQLDNQTKILLIEGWMLGYRMVEEDIIREHLKKGTLMLPDSSIMESEEDAKLMFRFNKLLEQYEKVNQQLDYLIILQPLEYIYSLRWRLEAENKQRALTGGGMDENKVKEFVSYYWQCLHPAIYVIKILNSFQDYQCRLTVNFERQVVQIECDQLNELIGETKK